MAYIAKSGWSLLFECSAHVSDDFQKKFGWGVGGCVETYPIFVGFF